VLDHSGRILGVTVPILAGETPPPIRKPERLGDAISTYV
jgi:hypothetical protein